MGSVFGQGPFVLRAVYQVKSWHNGERGSGYWPLPQNIVNAQQLAQLMDSAGEITARDEVLVAIASAPKAPPWFVQKAAFALSRQGRLKEAVGLLVQPVK